MLPAAAYTSEEVLAWELRHLYAGGWVCLGRREELVGATQRGVLLGDVPGLLTLHDGDLRLLANTCRHRGHELLADGATSDRPAATCPYHGWAYDLGGRLLAAPGYQGLAGFDPADHGLVRLPVAEWGGFVFGHGLRPVGDPAVPSFTDHLGDMAEVLAGYRLGSLRLGERHVYDVAANWKVVAENYHECYHCPEIHPELCAVSPPTSGDNHDLAGDWVGGRMDLRPGMATMSLTGASGGRPIEGAPSGTVEYLHLLPDLLVSAHPDYVMVHRLTPLAPGRTRVECSWYLPPDADGRLPDPAYAVDFWDLTNRQDWAACESVQRGVASPHFRPGPFAPGEDAVARLAGLLARAYDAGGAPAGVRRHAHPPSS